MRASLRRDNALPCRLESPMPDTASISRLAALAMLTVLAGCVADEKFAPDCPGLTLLPDAADLSRYRPGGRDLTDMALDAKINGVPAQCSRAGAGTIAARMNVTFAVSRGPAATGRNAVLAYFVGVTDGGQVLDEQDYQLPVAFPGNTDTVALNGQEITLNFPVSAEKSAAAYRIFVGFRLTPEQLAANRARGLR